MMQFDFQSRKLVPEVVAFLSWLLFFLIAILIEQSLGLPIVTLALVVLAVSNRSTSWAICFVVVATFLLAALLSTNPLLVWLIVLAMSTFYRSPLLTGNQLLLTRLTVVTLAALLIAFLKEPSANLSFVFHSGLSLIVAGYLIWRSIRKNIHPSVGVGLKLK